MGLVELPEAAHLKAEILIATTWQCNLRCSYCFVKEHNLSDSGAVMSPELAMHIVDALDEGLTQFESICIHLYGGEPLTNLPAIKAIINRAQQKRPDRFTFAITTNGTILSDAVIQVLAAGNFRVVLSIDGPEEIHNTCRRTAAGAPTHALTMQFLTALRKRTNCLIRGSSVVRPGWSLSQATAYLRTLPVDNIKAQAVRVPAESPYALSAAEMDAYFDDLEKVGGQVISDLESGRIPRDDRFSSRVLQLLKGGCREAFCGAGHTTFGITPTGDVLPCILMEADGCRLGNVKSSTHQWLQAADHWKSAQSLRTECETCKALPLCGGGCPAILPICGENECHLIRKNCEVATAIFDHFQSTPVKLLALAGIT